MSIPTNREEFTDWCLKKLGSPVIKPNVDDEQLQDRIDEALADFQNFHFDATEHVYVSHTVTTDEKANTSITLPSEIISVARVYIPNNLSGLSNFFNPAYQFRINDFFSFIQTSMIDYYLVQRHLTMIANIMNNGEKTARYSRYTGTLEINMDWANNVNAGDIIIFDCYKVIDPNSSSLLWNDAWLRKYAVALIRKQWATNLFKYQGVKLLGGVELNPQAMLDLSNQEIQECLDDLDNRYSYPPIGIVA